MASESTPKLPSAGDVMVQSLEVQLALFNTGLEFWRKYVSEAAKLSKALDDGIRKYKGNPESAGQVMKNITHAGTEHLRALSGLPGHLQKTFTTEMDRVKEAAPARGAPARKKGSAKAKARGTGKAKA